MKFVRKGLIAGILASLFILFYAFFHLSDAEEPKSRPAITTEGSWMTPLHRAVEDGDLAEVKKLIDQGADVNAMPVTLIHVDLERRKLRRGKTFQKDITKSETSLQSKGAAPLHLAAKTGNGKIISLLLESGADPNLPDQLGRTSLHYGAIYGHAEAVGLLITKTNVRQKSKRGWEPLHFAVNGNKADTVRVLLKRGASPDAPGRGGVTPLMIAAANNHLAAAELLLKHGVKVDTRMTGSLDRVWHSNEATRGTRELNEILMTIGVNLKLHSGPDGVPLFVTDIRGDPELADLLNDKDAPAPAFIEVADWGEMTPMQQAIYFENRPMIELMVRYGASINERDEHDSTLLHRAAIQSNDDAIRWLITMGADVNAIDSTGDTALGEFAQDGDREMIALLLKHGADPRLADHHGRTPLHKMRDCCFDDAVKLLVDHGGDINARDHDGLTPLHVAVCNGNWFGINSSGCRDNLPKALIQNGADVNIRTNRGNTPLHQSAGCCWTITRMLIKAGADVNARNQDGRTPLFMADSYDLPHLVEAGADLNATDKDGQTALHHQADSNALWKAKALLKAGININSRDNRGDTALHVAVRRHGMQRDKTFDELFSFDELTITIDEVKMITLLIENGAEINVKNNDGKSPMELAQEMKKQDIIKLFLEHGKH
ncbi:MAG: ankyrin repeat domain-containing protein [Candidatus Lernaella stagnicola]|nr:ankyrin repeat domain-containing protein [Candidatus Lernaella stagnicola]